VYELAEGKACTESPKTAEQLARWPPALLRRRDLLQQDSRHDPAPRREQAECRQRRKPISGQPM